MIMLICILLFQNCLGIIYSAYVDKLEVQLEVLVGNILGCVQVPPPGMCCFEYNSEQCMCTYFSATKFERKQVITEN